MKIEYYGMFFTNLMKSDKYFVYLMHYDVIMAQLQYFSFWLLWAKLLNIFAETGLMSDLFYQTKVKISKISKIINKNLCLNTY